jgi:hypothetical protein
MILGELIQRVQSLYSRGVQSDDTRLSSRHIYNKLLTARNKLLIQKSNKKQPLNSKTFQTLNCVEIVKVDKIECDCLTSSSFCKVYRTKHKIPNILSDIDKMLISSVNTLDNNIKFDLTLQNNVKYKSGNRYTKTKPEFYIKNGYFYFTSNSIPGIIEITAVFENPLEVKNFSQYCNNDKIRCLSNLDMEFSIDSDLIEVLIELATKELIIFFKQNSQDISNNAQDDSMTQK